jgi:hypothetical protein
MRACVVLSRAIAQKKKLYGCMGIAAVNGTNIAISKLTIPGAIAGLA